MCIFSMFLRLFFIGLYQFNIQFDEKILKYKTSKILIHMLMNDDDTGILSDF